MNPKKQEMIMRELEWGINSETNSLFLAGDVANETLHSMVVHLATLLRFNPEKDILITCGGDSQLLTKSLKTQKENIINAPNLVMEGMIIHYLSINN